MMVCFVYCKNTVFRSPRRITHKHLANSLVKIQTFKPNSPGEFLSLSLRFLPRSSRFFRFGLSSRFVRFVLSSRFILSSRLFLTLESPLATRLILLGFHFRETRHALSVLKRGGLLSLKSLRSPMSLRSLKSLCLFVLSSLSSPFVRLVRSSRLVPFGLFVRFVRLVLSNLVSVFLTLESPLATR